jgi:endonuclease YncB( thermonuclease family)
MSAALWATCLVIGISSGDTFTAVCNQKVQMKIRLADIYAPEKSQAFWEESKNSLSTLCLNTQAQIAIQSLDQRRRSVSRVTCNGIDVNAEQLKRGMAWVYEAKAQDRSLYALQDKARRTRQGLWGDPMPVPPWQWRYQVQNTPAEPHAK